MTALSALRVVACAALLVAGSYAAARAQDMVVVPTRVIYPGEVVSADSLQMVEFTRNKDGLPPLAIEPEDAEGKVARRTLLPGRLIAVSALRQAYAVEAGKPVAVMFVQGSLTISATGVPLQPGSIGDLIRVRNIDSGVVFSGVVMADGTIRVGAT